MAKQVMIPGHGASLPIREFEMKTFCKDPTICMIAKRGSGKSVVCRAILGHFDHLPGGVIISPTDEMTSFYGNFFPETYIYYTYKSSILVNLFERQKIMIEKCKKYHAKRKKVNPQVFLLMDDCLAEGAWKKDEQIAKIFYNGRHYRIMFILTMQFPLGIGPQLRCNIDYVFLLFDDFMTNQKKLFDHYAGMFPTFNFFRQVFVQLTDDYGCMVIVNRGANRNLTDKIFYYKAPMDGINSIGCKQFKQYHEYNFDSHYNEAKEKFDINMYEPKTNKPSISVKKMKK